MKGWSKTDVFYWAAIWLTGIVLAMSIELLVAYGQQTVPVPSGCFQRVYIADPATNR